jgi:hypothetical protein
LVNHSYNYLFRPNFGSFVNNQQLALPTPTYINVRRIKLSQGWYIIQLCGMKTHGAMVFLGTVLVILPAILSSNNRLYWHQHTSCYCPLQANAMDLTDLQEVKALLLSRPSRYTSWMPRFQPTSRMPLSPTGTTIVKPARPIKFNHTEDLATFEHIWTISLTLEWIPLPMAPTQASQLPSNLVLSEDVYSLYGEDSLVDEMVSETSLMKKREEEWIEEWERLEARCHLEWMIAGGTMKQGILGPSSRC